MLNILQARLQQYMNRDLQMLKLDFEKAEDPEIKCQHLLDHQKSKIIPEKNIYFCFIDYTKASDCVGHNQLRKVLQEMGVSDDLTCLLKNLYAGQDVTVKLDIEQHTSSKSEKEYVKAVYCHSAYLTYMQSTCKIPGWKKHKLESRLPREISTTSDMQMIPL